MNQQTALKSKKLSLALFRHDESLAAANGVMTSLVDKIDIHWHSFCSISYEAKINGEKYLARSFAFFLCMAYAKSSA